VRGVVPHTVSSPIPTQPTNFSSPEIHRNALQNPQNHALLSRPRLKFLPLCNNEEHLCYNRGCRDSSRRHLAATISTLPSEY
jgi:hypothetical protein